MRSSFSARSLLSEVSRNLWAPSSRRFILVLAVGAIAALVTLQTRADWASLQTESAALRSGGWSVYTFSSAEPTISAQRCRSAARLDGVVRAGAVERLAEPIEPSGLLTPLVIDSTLVSAPARTALVSSRFLEAHPDVGIVIFRGRPWRLAAGGPRFDTLQLGAVVAFPETIFDTTDTCVFELDLSWTTYNDFTVPATIGWSGEQPQLTSEALLSPGSHPFRRFLARTTRWLPLVAGFGTGVLYLIVGLALRNQMSVYRVIGYSRWSVLSYYLVEIIYLAVLATTVGVATIWAIEARQGLPVQASSQYLLAGCFSFVATASVLAPVMVTGNVIDNLKDR